MTKAWLVYTATCYNECCEIVWAGTRGKAKRWSEHYANSTGEWTELCAKRLPQLDGEERPSTGADYLAAGCWTECGGCGGTVEPDDPHTVAGDRLLCATCSAKGARV